jgi:dihydrofolate synthase/folylpolyglutamate synthase
MTFAETVRFLFSLGPELRTVKWDLERIRALMRELGDPQERLRFIHVAGTNGKGSVCAFIESALRVSGIKTGLYTSPHLVDPRERIRVAGELVTEPVWVQAFEDVHAAAERLLARDRIDAHPSFFETVTAMAFLAFERAQAEIVVLEVGLGGRLDATNIVLPEISVITPIDFDHEAFLGSSIEAIAAEKAGILKEDRRAVFAQQRPEALSVLERKALELNVPVTHSSAWRIESLESDRFGSRFTLAGDEEIPIVCPLAGEHQVENARTAVAALAVWGLSAAAIREGIARAEWPGRLERIAENFILDGAHNPAGARALAQYIRRFYANESVRIIYGAMRDKAVDEVTNTLLPLAAEVIVTAPNQPRALNPEALAEMTDHPNLKTTPSLIDAIALARKTPMPTFITGSLFLVGEARALFGRHDNFRSEVECYSSADPMPTLQNLSALTGVPVDRIIRYVLVKYAASSSDALMSLDPIVFRQMREQIDRAEAEDSDTARLRAYEALRQMIQWLGASKG